MPGAPLEPLHKTADGVIIIDNDSLVDAVPQMPTLEAFSTVNSKVSEALSWLLSTGLEGLEVGVEKVLSVVASGGYSVLGIGNSSGLNRAEDAVLKAVRSVYSAANPDETSQAIMFLAGDGVKMVELDISGSRLQSLLGRDAVEVHFGVAAGSGGGRLTAVVLASGIKSTRFDDYDPIDKILKGRTIDDSLEYHLDAPIEQIPMLPD